MTITIDGTVTLSLDSKPPLSLQQLKTGNEADRVNAIKSYVPEIFPNVVAFYPLLETTGFTVRDYSDLGLHGRLINGLQDNFNSLNSPDLNPTHQGVAVRNDGKIYTIHTDRLDFRNADWSVINTQDPFLSTVDINRMSGCDYNESTNELIVMAKKGTGTCASVTDESICIYDGTTLLLKSQIDISANTGTSVGVCIDANAGENGILYSVDFCDGTIISMHDLKTPSIYLGDITITPQIPDEGPEGITSKFGKFYIPTLNGDLYEVDRSGNSKLVFSSTFTGDHEDVSWRTRDYLSWLIDDIGGDGSIVHAFSLENGIINDDLNKIMKFNNSRKINIPSNSAIDDLGKFTYMLWLQYDGVIANGAGIEYIIAKDNTVATGSVDKILSIQDNDGSNINKLDFRVLTDGTTRIFTTVENTIDEGIENFFAVTYDNSLPNAHIYKASVKQTLQEVRYSVQQVGTGTDATEATFPLMLGGREDVETRNYSNKMRYVTIANKVLDFESIQRFVDVTKPILNTDP